MQSNLKLTQGTFANRTLNYFAQDLPPKRDVIQSAEDSNSSSGRSDTVSSSKPARHSVSRSTSQMLDESTMIEALQGIIAAGYTDPDAFISHYYNAALSQNSETQQTQQISRCRGLPRLLEDVMKQSG